MALASRYKHALPHLTLNLTAPKGKGKKIIKLKAAQVGSKRRYPASYAEIQELCLKYEGKAEGTLPPEPREPQGGHLSAEQGGKARSLRYRNHSSILPWIFSLNLHRWGCLINLMP